MSNEDIANKYKIPDVPIKYVYVLVSDESDLYFEQALLSITSLKTKMRTAYVTLLTDDKTAEYLRNDHQRAMIFDLLDEFKEISFSENFSKKYRSRWLKTSIRKHIDGDFLFLDSDTIVAKNLIIKKKMDLGAVLDIHLPLYKRFKNKKYQYFHIQRDKKLNFTTAYKNYFNSGVIFCSDTPASHDFFSEWHNLWISSCENGILEDQPSFSMANIKLNNIVTEMDGIWNCQLVRNGIPYLGNSKIIHYYNATNNEKNYFFAKISTYELIRKYGTIIPEISILLKRPYTVFSLNKYNNIKNKYKIIDTLFSKLLFFLFSPPLILFIFLISKIRIFFDKLEIRK